MRNPAERVRDNRSEGNTVVSSNGRVGFFLLRLYPQFITLTLGFYSLANAWQLQGIVFLQPIAFLFAVAMITLFFLRGISFPGRFIEEMHTPAAIVAYQTGIMALYYVAQMISTHIHYLMGVVLWGIAVLVNGIFILRFLTVHLYSSFTFRHFNPPWFLMAMGVCVSALTGREMGIVLLPEWILGYSFAAFMLVVPLLFVRLFRLPLPLDMQPTVGIFCAGPALILTTMLLIYPQIPLWFALCLLIMNKGILLWLYCRLPVFMKMPFSVTLASLTFPLGISNIATHVFRDNYVAGGSRTYSSFTIAGYVELGIATLIIVLVIATFFWQAYEIWKDTKVCNDP